MLSRQRPRLGRQVTRAWLCALLLAGAAAPALAQPTSAFTYQGRLTDGAGPANGTYQFQFQLFTAPVGGTPVGPTLTGLVVAVGGGLFTVTLDFGVSAFDGAARYVEVGVRPDGSPNPYTILSPRQQVTSAPYTVRSFSSLSADSAAMAADSGKLGGLLSNQYVLISDPRLSDARPPTSGSPNYVQNGTTPQAGASFNVAGNGTVGNILSGNVVNAANHFDIAGSRVLATPGASNLFVGADAGSALTTGGSDTFVGTSAGAAVTSSSNNTFVGARAGQVTTGDKNSFFGTGAGGANLGGVQNTFVGQGAGFGNTTGSNNTSVGMLAGASTAGANGTSFFGAFAGENNTAQENSFFGDLAGKANTSGDQNNFFGSQAGLVNTTGFGNSFFGTRAGLTNVTGSNNSFFGTDAGRMNTAGGNSFVGRSAGFATTTGGNNVFVGLDSGRFNTTGGGNAFVGVDAGFNNTTGSNNTFVGVGSGNPDTATQVTHSAAIGAGAVVSASNTIVIGTASEVTQVPGSLRVSGTLDAITLDSNGQVSICHTASHRFAFCSSSLRYKTDVEPYGPGLDVVQRLHPIRFTWKDGGARDLGLGAEDVAPVEPLLVTRNGSGEVEGVKYDRVAVILVNAVREQQAEIARLAEELRALRQRLEAIKAPPARPGNMRGRPSSSPARRTELMRTNLLAIGLLALAAPAMAKDLAASLPGNWVVDKEAAVVAMAPPFYKMATPEKQKEIREDMMKKLPDMVMAFTATTASMKAGDTPAQVAKYTVRRQDKTTLWADLVPQTKDGAAPAAEKYSFEFVDANTVKMLKEGEPAALLLKRSQ